MAWAKFDDRWDDHRKIKLAWHRSRAAVAIHAMSITYSARHETDGFIDEVWLLERLPDADERNEAVSALVDVGLFERADDGYVIRDFLEYNPSRADQQEKRRKDAERKARGRTSAKRGGPEGDDGETPPGVQSPGPRSPDGSHGGSARSPNGVRTDSHDPVRDPSARPVPTRPDPTHKAADAPASAHVREAAADWRAIEPTLSQVPEWAAVIDQASVSCLALIEANRDVPWPQIAAAAAASRLDPDAGLRTNSPRQALDMQLADHRSGRSTGAGERGTPRRRQQRSSLDHYRDMAAEFAAEDAGPVVP